MSGKVQIIEIHIQAASVGWLKMIFSILEEEGSLTYTPTAFDANQTVRPVNFINQKSSDR